MKTKTIYLPTKKVKVKQGFWDAYFRYYDILLQVAPYQQLMYHLVKGLQVQDGHRILDAGCGTGNINYFIKKDCEMFAIDSSSAALQRVKKKFPWVITQKQSLSNRNIFPDKFFDRIVSSNVLYTIPKKNWPKVIAEWKRILRPGGIIAIANPVQAFSPLDIYKTHIRQSAVKKGWYETLGEMAKLLFPTMQMFRYNRTIKAKDKTERYQFMRLDEQSALMEIAGFSRITEDKSVYADQAVLGVYQLNH